MSLTIMHNLNVFNKIDQSSTSIRVCLKLPLGLDGEGCEERMVASLVSVLYWVQWGGKHLTTAFCSLPVLA